MQRGQVGGHGPPGGRGDLGAVGSAGVGEEVRGLRDVPAPRGDAVAGHVGDRARAAEARQRIHVEAQRGDLAQSGHQRPGPDEHRQPALGEQVHGAGGVDALRHQTRLPDHAQDPAQGGPGARAAQRQPARGPGVVDEVGAGRAHQRQQRLQGRRQVEAGHRPARSAARGGGELLPRPAGLAGRRAVPAGRQRPRSDQPLVVVHDQRRDVVRHALQRRVGAERLQAEPLEVVPEQHAARVQQLVDGLHRVRRDQRGDLGVLGQEHVGSPAPLTPGTGGLGVRGVPQPDRHVRVQLGVALRQAPVGVEGRRGAVHGEPQGHRRCGARRRGGGARARRWGAVAGLARSRAAAHAERQRGQGTQERATHR